MTKPIYEFRFTNPGRPPSGWKGKLFEELPKADALYLMRLEGDVGFDATYAGPTAPEDFVRSILVVCAYAGMPATHAKTYRFGELPPQLVLLRGLGDKKRTSPNKDFHHFRVV